MTRPLLATIPETRCPPTSRYFADPETWRAIAASPEFTFTALWAEPGAVIALLETNGAPVLVSVAVEQGFYPALSPFHPHATAFERMLRDLWGYNAVGATDARAMLDFGHWPVATPMARPTATGPPERPTSGFAHKGTLALLRGKSPRAAARFAARLDGEATVSHSIAFARAAEADIAPPPRALALRDLMATIEHLAFGLDHLGAIAQAADAALLAAACARLREATAGAAAAAFGHRLMMDAVIPGGVAIDLAPDGAAHLSRLARTIHAAPLAPLIAATLDQRLRDLPQVAARTTNLLATTNAAAATIPPQLDTIPPGPLAITIPPRDGEALGQHPGPRGTATHWLRLEGGQIAAAFLLDPTWHDPAPISADDHSIINAAFAAGPSGSDL